MFACTLAFVLLVSCYYADASEVQAPVIGILVEPPLASGDCVTIQKSHGRHRHEKGGNITTGCVWSIYVRWLEAAGIRVVPIPWDASTSHIDFYLSRVNGVFLTGGELDSDPVLLQRYFQTVQYIYDAVVHSNTVIHNPIVLWGTCQGFQLSIPPSEYAAGTAISRAMVMLGTANDVVGRAFVAVAEGKNAAVFAVQFHPERPPYEFDNDKIGHEPKAIEVSNYLNLFLREQLVKCHNTFRSDAELNNLTIETYTPVNQGWGVQIYFV